MKPPTFVSFVMAFIMAMAFALLGVVAYWVLAPYDVMSVDGSKITIYSNGVTQGGVLEYGRHWCKNTDSFTGTVTREFVDGVRYITPDVAVYYAKGCQDSRVVLMVPMIPPGTYRLHTLVEYRVNPIRTKRYDFWTEPFEVRARPVRPTK